VKYLLVDRVHFAIRIDGKVENIPALVAVGGNRAGGQTGLGVADGRQGVGLLLAGVIQGSQKKRRLDGSRVVLGIMEGLPRLERVFQEEFPQAQVQRCQVHVARNVLAKVP
jgi:putative transposase